MMIKEVCLIATIFSLISCAPNYVQNSPITSWLEFVGEVRDCSSDNYYCLSGDILNVSFPKRCADVLRAEWYGTPIIDQGNSSEYQLHSGLMRVQNIYILGDDNYPFTVYVYSGTGILGIYNDPEKRVNLVSVAKAQGLEGLVNLGGVRDRYFHPAIADVIWGRCQAAPKAAEQGQHP